MTLPHCEFTTIYPCHDVNFWSHGTIPEILDCDKFSRGSHFGNLTDVSLVSAQFHGNWTLYRYLPECWNVLESGLCSLLFAPCRADSLGREFFHLRRIRNQLCLEITEKCPFLDYVFQRHPRFLFCDSKIYSSVNCGQTGVYLPTNVQTFECLAPALVTTNSDLWIPKTNYCGLPCSTFYSNSIYVMSSLRSGELLIHILLFLLLHLASKTLMAPDFKFLRGSTAINVMLCLSSILVPLFDDNFWCDPKTSLLVVHMSPKWTATFATAVLMSCSQYVLLMLQLFWLLLRLKYFPMSKCVAFGDKEYHSMLKPGKRKTMNFLTFAFLCVVVFVLMSTGTIRPNIITKLPVIEMENDLLIHFKFSIETILIVLVVATLVIDALQHKTFKRTYALLCLIVSISSFVRFYSYQLFRESTHSLLDFFFEKFWKCRLIGSDQCPKTLPTVSIFWPSIAVILLNTCDYFIILYIVFLIVPSLKDAIDLQTALTNSFAKLKQIPSRLFSGDNTKVTVLISNQSCDGKVETFYSPSPSMNNIKDIQIVRSDKPCDETFRKEKVIYGENKQSFDTLVRAEIPNVTSHSLTKDDANAGSNNDHQLVDCPDCAKSIRVATWVNYLPHPVPKRKSFLPLDLSSSPVKPRNYTCSCSPSSSNTMNPIFQLPYSMAIRNSGDQQHKQSRTISTTPCEGQPRSVPASPKLSARSHSVGSASQNVTTSKDAYVTFTANQVPLLESHRRILSQYNASPVTQRRKPLSPLVTGNRNDIGFPTGTQSNPTTLRVPRNSEENRTPSVGLENGGDMLRSSCSTTSNEGGESDSFDSEEETRTEIGLCTSLL